MKYSIRTEGCLLTPGWALKVEVFGDGNPLGALTITGDNRKNINVCHSDRLTSPILEVGEEDWGLVAVVVCDQLILCCKPDLYPTERAALRRQILAPILATLAAAA